MHANVPSAIPINPDDQHVSHVRLSGLWLEQLGFAIGTKLRTTASAGGWSCWCWWCRWSDCSVQR
nr:SymE family type I addiction module toxin [Xanthomonas pisi]